MGCGIIYAKSRENCRTFATTEAILPKSSVSWLTLLPLQVTWEGTRLSKELLDI